MMRSPHGFGSYLRLVPRWSLGAQYYERTPIQRQPTRALLPGAGFPVNRLRMVCWDCP
jgi:hypothetical protein